LLNTVTYRISLESLNAEQVDEREADKSPGYGIYPRYNAASNSLLYISDHKVEALNFDTDKRSTIFDFDGYYLGNSCVRGWVNAPDGEVALEILGNWWDGPMNYAVFGKGNSVRMSDRGFSWSRAEPPEPPPHGEIEKALIEKFDIVCFAAHGNYIYYVETIERNDYKQYGIRDLYRIKSDGSDKKLLRAKTNIFSLWSEGGRLLCFAHLPDKYYDDYNYEYGFYTLDENGKVANAIAHGFDGEWSNTDIERLGDLTMFMVNSHGSAENALITLYDPATDAMFSTQK
jgi:hypothetical protein